MQNTNITKNIKLFYKLSSISIFFGIAVILGSAITLLLLLIFIEQLKNLSQKAKNNFYLTFSSIGLIILTSGIVFLSIYSYCKHLKKHTLEKFDIKFGGYTDDCQIISELEEKFIKIRAIALALSIDNKNENLFLLTENDFNKKNLPFSFEDLENFKKDYIKINEQIDEYAQKKILMSLLNSPIVRYDEKSECKIRIGKKSIIDSISIPTIEKFINIFKYAENPNHIINQSSDLAISVNNQNNIDIKNLNNILQDAFFYNEIFTPKGLNTQSSLENFQSSSLFINYKENLKTLKNDKNLDVFGRLYIEDVKNHENKRFLPKNLFEKILSITYENSKENYASNSKKS
jgi:hypothetical protein